VGVALHDLQKEEDERREKVLREMGLRVVRFGNDDVVKNVFAVVGKIKKMTKKQLDTESLFLTILPYQLTMCSISLRVSIPAGHVSLG